VASDRENVAGKVVVITRASSGLGEATARHLAECGATVVLGARRVERLRALVAEITAKGCSAFALATDVTDATQVQALVDALGCRSPGGRQSVQQEREEPADDAKADDGVGDRVEIGRVGTGFHSVGSSRMVVRHA
jgi:NAD(P)-dependent dehydrogenase (short-subunit alcohol dehydrogenase family)